MRRNTNTEDFLRASNSKETEEMKAAFFSLMNDLNYFKERLPTLRKKSLEMGDKIRNKGNNSSGDVNKHSVEEEVFACQNDADQLTKLIIALEDYIEKIKYSTFLSIKVNKMSDADIAILKTHATNVRDMRNVLEQEVPDTMPSAGTSAPAKPAQQGKKLCNRFSDAEKSGYQIATWKIWARRTALVLGCLVAAAAAIAITCAIMTPGVNIITALVMVPVALTGILAFLGLHKPVSIAKNTKIDIDGISMNISGSLPVMASLGALIPGAMALKAVLKDSTIIKPPRETTARNLQAATLNILTDTLIKKIELLSDETHKEVKAFLLGVVEKTDKMYNKGVGNLFHESQTTRIKKAQMILRETAKIMEKDKIPETVSEILNSKVSFTVNKENKELEYSHVLNIQRDKPHFFNQNTKLKSDLIENGLVKEADWPKGQLTFA
ncbi:MAG: hypothetical protein NTZ67_09740 [Gammaproteobacteria bacterium]|nr:hypothetical protein [Gammaproteobacteria bacterium]